MTASLSQTHPNAAAFAFAEWLADDVTLTPVETRIVRTLGLRFGSWLPVTAIADGVYRGKYDPDKRVIIDADRHSIRTHIWRIRRKLSTTCWRIENRFQHGVYRLVSSE